MILVCRFCSKSFDSDVVESQGIPLPSRERLVRLDGVVHDFALSQKKKPVTPGFVLPPKPVKPVVKEESLFTPEQPYTLVERRPKKELEEEV